MAVTLNSDLASPRFSAPQVRAIMVGLMMAILLGALDQTIVSVALPRMVAELSGVELLSWVISGYLVAVAVSTPIYGKLGDVYGRRLVLSVAICIFIAMSVVCAMATSIEMLLVARILQGIGGGGLISVATITVADVVDSRERGRYQGYISGAYALANVSGPIVGGLLTEHISWRGIFWINLPLGLLALFVCRRVLARLPVPTGKKARIDYLGAGILAAGLALVLIGLARIGQGAFEAHSVGSLIACGMLLLAVYVWLEKRTEEPLVPLRIFRYPAVGLCCALLFVIFFELVSLTVLVPMRLQLASDMRVDLAALSLLPLTVAMPLGSMAAGVWIVRSGRSRLIQLTGAVLVPPALVLLACFPQTGMTFLALTLAGLGLGIQIPAVMALVQNAVPRTHLGVVTAASSFFRAFGAAVGTAVLTALLLATLRDVLPSASLFEARQLAANLASGADALAAAAHISAAVHDAFQTIFLVAAVVALALPVCGIWLPLTLERGVKTT